MALIDSLKSFYKNNVKDINKLNDADSVLEVLRAKYGDYKGSNIEEYIKELVNNDITPGGSTPTGTIAITENGEGIDISSYAYADVNVSGGLNSATVTISGEKNYCQADFSPTMDPITEVNDIIQAVYVVEESLYKSVYAWTEEEVAEGVTADFLMLTPSFTLNVVYDSDNPSNITITGNAVLSQDDANKVIVSGDCTIHLVGWDG